MAEMTREELVQQIKDLLAQHEHSFLLSEQETRSSVLQVRDDLQDQLDQRFDAFADDINALRAARSDFEAAVALLKATQERLDRLVPMIEQPAQTIEDNARALRAVRWEMRLGASALAAGLAFTLGLLILHVVQMMQVSALAGG